MHRSLYQQGIIDSHSHILEARIAVFVSLVAQDIQCARDTSSFDSADTSCLLAEARNSCLFPTESYELCATISFDVVDIVTTF